MCGDLSQAIGGNNRRVKALNWYEFLFLPRDRDRWPWLFSLLKRDLPGRDRNLKIVDLGIIHGFNMKLPGLVKRTYYIW